MRLRNLDLPADCARNGLKDIHMRRLGQVVALLGPNGAGKSRLLRLVEDIMREDARPFGERKQAHRLLGRTESVSEHDLRINEWYSFPPTGTSVIVRLNPDLQILGKLESITAFDIASSVANHLSLLGNPNQPNSVSPGVMPFFYLLAQAASNANNPEISGPNYEHRFLLFGLARDLTQKLLRTELGFVYRDDWADVVPTLGGREMNPNELSDGQKLLLYYIACLLVEAATRAGDSRSLCLKGAVIILDEPELHLHPASLVGVLEGFRDIVGESGQVWIASHASALLSSLTHTECWLMSDGEVIPPNSETFAQGFELLLGSPQAVERLREKVQESALWAAAAFAAECLLAPTQVAYQGDDPQLLLLGEVLQSRRDAGDRIVILDYGAGKGRLAESLRKTGKETGVKIEYIPVESGEELRTEITEAAGCLLSPVGVLRDISELPTQYSQKVDVVVLCNVLHEIAPRLWPKTLNALIACLRNEGSLLICEDLMMPVGESPNRLGFFVLGADEIQTLFSLSSSPKTAAHRDPRYSGRLLCIEIPRAEAVVTSNSVRGAIEQLKARMMQGVKRMRTEAKATGREGRLYALYSQAFINCTLAIDELWREDG